MKVVKTKTDVRVTPERTTPGRKSGTLTVDVNRSRYEVPLRVDVDKGIWYAFHDGLMYSSEVKADIGPTIAAAILAKEPLVWTRYIDIDYEANGVGRWTSRPTFKPGQSRGDYDISGISLSWKIVEYSQPIKQQNETFIRMTRWVSDDLETTGHDERAPAQLPDGVILFTPECLATLQSIRAALVVLDGKLSALFSGGLEEVGSRLADFTTKTLGPGGS